MNEFVSFFVKENEKDFFSSFEWSRELSLLRVTTGINSLISRLFYKPLL